MDNASHTAVRTGLFARRECWVPTRRLWVVLAVLLLGGAFLASHSLSSFLSARSPVSANVLVVEGWLPDFAMQGAIEEFKRGGYKYVITSGGGLPDGWLAGRFKTGAEFAAANLAALGLPTNVIVPAPSARVGRDRTYAAALAVKEWLRMAHPEVRAVNLYSLGPHARRSRLLFQKAMGNKVKVGVIAHPDNRYDSKRWWASMDGFTEVTQEGFAYLYAKCLFRPPAEHGRRTTDH
ncbi:MAG: ElyC/SanA/YdcF family protein [Verrucomicrobiota bacterium]|jgi:uncharacterized SAM-binding protein YcdF (DUF218 family)